MWLLGYETSSPKAGALKCGYSLERQISSCLRLIPVLSAPSQHFQKDNLRMERGWVWALETWQHHECKWRGT